MDRQFIIIGAGMGQISGLTYQAKETILGAAQVFAAPRIAKSLEMLRQITPATIPEMTRLAVSSDTFPVALIVSGDTGFFSLAKSLRVQLESYGTVTILPGLSSMQYLCAKCGQSYDDAYILSLHGREGSILGAVSYHKKVFVLTGGNHTAKSICQDLTEAGMGQVIVYLGENLGSERERVFEGHAEDAAKQSASELAVLLIINPQAVNRNTALKDNDFIRGQVPMTKQEVRWTAVHLLNLHSKDIVYDIGAGTGSVAIEMARHVPDGLVYAIERNDAGLQLIRDNRKHLGAGNVIPIAGYAPNAFSKLPIPNAAFIGGSGGELLEILTWLKGKNPSIRICISAIALETLNFALDSMKKLQFSNIEICQISAARGKKVAGYTMMTANNPVFLISGGGNE